MPAGRFARRALVCVLAVFWLTGCQVAVKEAKGRESLDYTVLDEDEIPEELRDTIEARKTQPFQVTLEEDGRLYIGRGYGSQPTGGYTIRVMECSAAKGIVYVRTELEGPGYDQEPQEERSFPYLVIETKQSGNYVVFE